MVKQSEPMITSAAFDLETSSLNADFGIVLCAVVKPAGGKPIVFRADELNKKWKTRRSDDSAIVSAVAEELQKYDLLAGHNAAYFDIPFLQSRLSRWGLPLMPKMRLIDPWWIIRRQLKLSSNSLERASDFLGFNQKTPVSGQVWMQAYLDGNLDAMSEIVKHCIADVDMLEELVRKVKRLANVPAW